MTAGASGPAFRIGVDGFCVWGHLPEEGSPNKNYGDEVTTWIRGSGNDSVLIQFDQQEIEAAVADDTILSATPEMESVDGTASSWGQKGKDVGTYRLMHSWTELGHTWNCGKDTDPATEVRTARARPGK